MRPAVIAVAQLVAGIVPGGEREAEDIRSTLAWMYRTDDVFRRVKPAIPNRHLVSGWQSLTAKRLGDPGAQLGRAAEPATSQGAKSTSTAGRPAAPSLTVRRRARRAAGDHASSLRSTSSRSVRSKVASSDAGRPRIPPPQPAAASIERMFEADQAGQIELLSLSSIRLVLGFGHGIPRGPSDKGREAFAARCSAYIPRRAFDTDVIGVLLGDRALSDRAPCCSNTRMVRIRQLSLQPRKLTDQCQCCPE